MVGMGTPVARDLPPHVKAYGSPLRLHGVNTIGLERRGIPSDEVAALADTYLSGDLLLESFDLSKVSDDLAAELTQWRERENRKPAQTAWEAT